jgi:hypothetical protein
MKRIIKGVKMASITFKMPDEIVPRVLDTFVKVHNYQEIILVNDTLADETAVPNPETKLMFLKRMMLEYVLGSIQGYKIKQATKEAGVVALAKAKKKLL